jgi:ribonuclease P protein component
VQRLKTRAQFQAVLGDGKPVSRTTHFVLHRLNLPVPNQPPAAIPATGPESTRPQALFAVGPAGAANSVYIGAMVPKRWAKRAVTRNTIKRQIYTLCESYGARWPVAAHVVRLRSGFDRKQFISATSEVLKLAVRQELQQLFERAESPTQSSSPKAAEPAP